MVGCVADAEFDRVDTVEQSWEVLDPCTKILVLLSFRQDVLYAGCVSGKTEGAVAIVCLGNRIESLEIAHKPVSMLDVPPLAFPLKTSLLGRDLLLELFR